VIFEVVLKDLRCPGRQKTHENTIVSRSFH
jgi:hypothetical protein